jgi:glycopeptide antibiotics resistance protein
MMSWPSNMGDYMIKFWIGNVVGNIILFMSLGFILPLLWDRVKSLKKIIILAFTCSLIIEIIQFLSQFIGSYRSSDIDDIILNTLGGLIGFYFYSFIVNSKLIHKAHRCFNTLKSN